jgi:adenine-specific DNA-methyltransferase
MAHIDDLVKQVSDPQLRAALMQQVSTLTSRKQFGLVFQEHSPESVRLPQQRVRTGDKVELRESKESSTFHVISTKASLDAATVVELDGSGETVGEPQDMLKSDLVVVKPFGDPVYPGLRQVGEAGSAKSGQPTHVVINGENYHALQALEYTHAGKVDLIYIDPPYNTGNSDWKYNDKYIDSTDAYRHSRWLSFMEKRLRIAKRMLKSTGILFLSIDDREHARLKMLCDQIFGPRNFVANFVWRTDGKTDNQATVKPNHEYILMYAADATRMKIERVIDPNTSASSKLHTSEVRNSIVKNGPKNPVSAIELPIGFPATLAPSHKRYLLAALQQRTGRGDLKDQRFLAVGLTPIYFENSSLVVLKMLLTPKVR